MDPIGMPGHAEWSSAPDRSEVRLELTKQRSARWDPIRALLLLARERWREAVAEGVGFEPTRERNPLPVFKTGALNHSAILPESNPTRGLPPRLEKAHRQRTSTLDARSRAKTTGPGPGSPPSSLRAAVVRQTDSRRRKRAR